MVTDQEIIARASGGLALCGTYVGTSEEDFGRKRPKKQLLRSPHGCDLKNSDQAFEARSHSCCNIRASDRFREDVTHSGWSAGLNLHANICGFGVEAFGGGGRYQNKHTTESSQTMTKEACHMQIWYCPKASFAIPLHQMHLSEEALNDARRVQNTSDAAEFLSAYNSHLSTGTYHLGGVLIKALVMESRNTTSLAQMLESVSTNASVGAGLNFELFKVAGNVEFANERGSSSTDKEATHSASVKYVFTALGPKTDEEENFKAQLSNEKSTWDIIDKMADPELLPVWEIPSVKNAEDLQKCCGLLREAWQKSVKKVSAGRTHLLLQASCMENVKSLLQSVKPLLAGGLAESLTSEDLQVLKKTFRGVWLVIEEHLDESKTKDLFEVGEFQDLLNRLAESDLLAGGRTLLRGCITPNWQIRLKQDGILWSDSVQAVLQNEIETVAPLAPMEDMSLRGLVGRLKALLGPNPGAIAAVRAFDSIAVAEEIRDFFHDGFPEKEVRRCVTIHGFNEHGEIEDKTRLTREKVTILVEQLELLTSGSQNHTTTDRRSEGKRNSGTPPSRNENLEDMLGRSPHLLRLERSSTAIEGGLIHEGIYTVHSGHMLVDRPKQTDSDDPRRRMMDRIRHRLDPFASTTSKPAKVPKRRSFFTGVNIDMSGDDIAESHSTLIPRPPEILVQLLTSSDLLIQTALFQLLLDARIGIPLVVPLKMPDDKMSDFGHLAEALDFVRVKIKKQEILSIAKDTQLPRVVFLSNRKSTCETSDMASKVMNFQLPSQFFKGGSGDGTTIVELGVGFLRIPPKNPDDETEGHEPCLVFSVWGDHNVLGKFLAKVADFIIVEIGPLEEARSISWTKGHSKENVIYWKIDSSRNGCKNEPHWTFWGSFQQISEDIEAYLLEGIVECKLFKGASKGGAATLQQGLMSIPTFKQKTPVFNLANLDGNQLAKAKESLKLQKIFANEAVLYFASLEDRKNKPEHDAKRRELQNERKKLASEILQLPLLQTFVAILSLKHYVERNLGIVNLELHIETKLHFILKSAYEKEAHAFEESQKHQADKNLSEQYKRARKEHVHKKLGLEHLWRELSHIFVANTPLKFLPQLAAEHLIDGFPLEILDGDASLFNSLWVESVLSELNLVLSDSLKHKPKVFVLSVIGLQSSGKSSMLNVMFGTKLKTSAGQCTRGVYLQLIKSERKEFDYVLILDTEGIRSPEFYLDKNAGVHDNRLATFAVLPADACIVMVANEDDNGLKEVLPMVMLAFKGSAVAERSAGRRQAKVCFAYRSVDTNDVSKLERNQRKLQESLRNACKDVENMSNRESSKGSSRLNQGSNHGIGTLLKDFRGFSSNEEESDVKYFGNLKKGNVPPGDTPDWDYGRRVEQLREYIHKRVTDDGWKAFELNTWAQHLNSVWDCITEANFEMSFRSRMEYDAYHKLQDRLVTCRQQVGKKWMEDFQEVERALQVERGTAQKVAVSFERYWINLESTVRKTMDETAEEVKVILEEPQWQEWQVSEQVIWKKFCCEQEVYWRLRLQECIDAIFKFDTVVKHFNVKIQMEIRAETRNFDMKSPNRQKTMESWFEAIFERILKEARRLHGVPLAESVPSKVSWVYESSSIVGQKHGTFSKNEPCTTGLHFSSNNLEEEPSDSNSPKNFKPLRWVKEALFTKEKNSAPQISTQEVIGEIKEKVAVYLQDKKQYADHLVDQMISSTEKSAEHFPKNEQYFIHCQVMQFLTKKLVDIQKKWDKNHNVSKLLEAEEPRLWQFFQNCVNQEDGTKLLSTDVNNLLKSKLMDSFRSHLSNDVLHKLLKDTWTGNWIVMRAHLDLHLIDLIETGRTTELVQCARNGASHYKQIVDALIRKDILVLMNEGRLWEAFLQNIAKAMTTAALRAENAAFGSAKVWIFVQSLLQSINANVGAGSVELTRSISNYVDEGVYASVYSEHGTVFDFLKVADDVRQGLNSLKPDFSAESVEGMVKLVTDKMVECTTDNVGPRCSEACPHCKLTCFGAVNHAGLHDTLHQPRGLAGLSDARTYELWPRSCSDGVEANERFHDHTIGLNEPTPYADWSKHYPGWKLPTKAGRGTVHVREYIFAHYQEEIVQYYRSLNQHYKICSAIPPEYLLHDLGQLRCRLESTIKSI